MGEEGDGDGSGWVIGGLVRKCSSGNFLGT